MSKYAGFESVKLTSPQQSVFDLSHQKRITSRMGILGPVLCEECMPGDVWRGSIEILLRAFPFLAPIYDKIEMYVHVFFVPNRLLWDEWEDFITGGRLGVGVDPAVAPIPPYIDIGACMGQFAQAFTQKRSLLDWLGVPDLPAIDPTTANWNGKKLDMMPVLAYQLIWMEYYRDRNFVADNFMTFPKPSGVMNFPATNDYMFLRGRSYEHDYFTSALPFTQRGDEVLIPLAGSGSVTYLDQSLITQSNGTSPFNIGSATGALGFQDNTTGAIAVDASFADQGDAQIQNIDEVLIDSSDVSINEFRQAYALQVWLERNAVAGSRYTESLKAHFNVRAQDSRLQRPEYLGGGRMQVNINEVVSLAYAKNQDDDTVPQGNMAGHAITYGDTNHFNYFCAEHGFIVANVSIMNPTSYHQGMPRMFYGRRTFLGYPWPTFAKLGEQPVHDAEIYCTPASLTPDGDGEYPTFGYQSRYSEWKYRCSTNRGNFHDSLLFWTLTRDFDDAPVLSAEFNSFDFDTEARIFAAPEDDNFLLWVQNNLTVKRKLPYFGTPNTMGFV